MKCSDYAFPVSGDTLDKKERGHFSNAGERSPLGLSKEEYFAGLALQGLLANNHWSQFRLSTESWILYKEEIAKGSVEMAKELITQLNK